MIVTADEKRRVALPEPAQPGDVFDLEKVAQGRFVLTLLQAPKQKVRLESKDGYLVAVTDHVITQEETRRCLNEFP